MFSNSSKKSFETVDLVFREQSVAESTSSKDKHKCVVLDDEEAWKKFFEMQNSPSTNTTNTKNPKPGFYKDSYGTNRCTIQDDSKYHGKNIIGKVAEKIQNEISKKNNAIKFVRIKESKLASFDEKSIVQPSLRVILNSDEKETINMIELLSCETCKRCNVKSMTLMLPTTGGQFEKRGIRCRVDEDGTRIYEVANGSYNMTLNWYVEGKECKMKINISDDGSVKLIESNGVTWEQLAAHKEVKVGRQYEAKPLYEALSYLKQESSEIVEVSQQPSTSVTQPTKVENVKKTQEEKQKDTAQGVGR
ncbi:hypothetical protein [Wolbachia endosymbiont of Oedothorax gibbosus]|uniref:hypothetical protein n=1 Tax=Wolbachia endosymbiont of Oedothorax gibbosus TaxID=931100 RepID=UPI002024566F|nr:hypothetical protein [Wolbachia endosymbiont of Oedothorax gibbosus]